MECNFFPDELTSISQFLQALHWNGVVGALVFTVRFLPSYWSQAQRAVKYTRAICRYSRSLASLHGFQSTWASNLFPPETNLGVADHRIKRRFEWFACSRFRERVVSQGHRSGFVIYDWGIKVWGGALIWCQFLLDLTLRWDSNFEGVKSSWSFNFFCPPRFSTLFVYSPNWAPDCFPCLLYLYWFLWRVFTTRQLALQLRRDPGAWVEPWLLRHSPHRLSIQFHAVSSRLFFLIVVRNLLAFVTDSDNASVVFKASRRLWLDAKRRTEQGWFSGCILSHCKKRVLK